jgi:undecaprenyl-diphosphatase
MNISLFNFFFSLSSYPFIAGLALFISNIFMYVVIISAIIITFFIKRDNVYSLLIVGTGAFSWVVSYVIKNITKIPRPFVELNLTPLFMETGFSFPSSHVTVIAALSVIVWNIDYRLGILFFIFTVLVALSRMIIGVHYPIDVVSGLIIGVIIGLSILWFYNNTSQFAFLRKYI